MSKQAWISLVIMSLAVALLLGQIASANELQTVRLSEVVRSVFYAPQYVAIEKGFFEENGLKIDLSTAWGADKGAAALISGSVDVGFFGPEAAIYIYQQQSPELLIGFAQLTARDGSFFMRRQITTNAFSWDDVRGETIVGGRKGGVPQMVLEWVLKENNIKPFVDVEILTNLAFEAAVGAFEVGVGDYIAQFEPAVSTVESRKRGQIVASLGEEAGPITYTVYHARQSSLEKNPGMFVKFAQAIHQGQLWVHESSPEEIAEVIGKFFLEIDHDILVKTITRYKEIDAWPITPEISEEGFEKLQSVMLEAGELHEKVDFDVIMSNKIANVINNLD